MERVRTPRSPRTALILLLLKERPMTARELAEQLGMYPSEVSAYLNYYRRRGVLGSEDGVWRLTDTGRKVVKEWETHLTTILDSKYGIKSAKVSKSRLNFIPYLESRIKEWAGPVYNECKDVIELFLKLRERGVYVELPAQRTLETLWELARELGISSIDTGRLGGCLQDLRARGVLYVYKTRGVVKIRINRRLEEASIPEPRMPS